MLNRERVYIIILESWFDRLRLRTEEEKHSKLPPLGVVILFLQIVLGQARKREKFDDGETIYWDAEWGENLQVQVLQGGLCFSGRHRFQGLSRSLWQSLPLQTCVSAPSLFLYIYIYICYVINRFQFGIWNLGFVCIASIWSRLELGIYLCFVIVSGLFENSWLRFIVIIYDNPFHISPIFFYGTSMHFWFFKVMEEGIRT